MRLKLLPVFLAVVFAARVSGQILHANGPLPSFEVASIKPWKASSGPGANVPIKIDPVQRVKRHDTNRVRFIGQIGLLIMDAYNLPVGSEKRIFKGPTWVESESNRYEVDAKIDAEMFAAMQSMTPQQQHEQVELMEQSLLSERLNLRVHFEKRGEAEVYALVVAKGGLKIAPSQDGETTSLSSVKHVISARGVTLNEFARSPLWTPIGDRPVVNQTGLTGRYDFTLRWRSDELDDSGAVQDDLPPLFDAIREQLGLKVIDAKTPLEVIVIDHIDRPTRN